MSKSTKVDQVVKDLHLLNETEKVIVLKRLVKLIKEPQKSILKNKKVPKLTDLAGVGKDVWEKINVDDYIRELRHEWD